MLSNTVPGNLDGLLGHMFGINFAELYFPSFQFFQLLSHNPDVKTADFATTEEFDIDQCISPLARILLIEVPADFVYLIGGLDDPDRISQCFQIVGLTEKYISVGIGIGKSYFALPAQCTEIRLI